MKEKEKYHFSVIPKRKPVSSIKETWVTISKARVLIFNSTSCQQWFPKGSYVRMFVDESKRMVALKPIGRVTTPAELKDAKKILEKAAQVSFAQVVNLFNLKEFLPIKQIPLELYTDDVYGDVVIFKIPLPRKTNQKDG